MRNPWEEYLQEHALPNSVQYRDLFVCPNCGDPFNENQVKNRRERGLNWIQCSNCDTRVPLHSEEELAKPSSRIAEMDREADSQRERAVGQASLQGKITTNDFDVFLCHNEMDKPAVKKIGEKLKEFAVLPWLDEWELRPGLPRQPELELLIGEIKSAAVFIGKNGIGPWQQEELAALLREFVRRKCPVIPVLLPNASKKPRLPLFLQGFTWVDFRQIEPDPNRQLIWGITGQRPL